MLLQDNNEVVHLSRRPRENSAFRSFRWDPRTGYCDGDAFHHGDIIIHLAGANIGAGRWTGARKREITGSRVTTARMIFRATVAAGIIPSAFITASATGIYGSVTSERIYSET